MLFDFPGSRSRKQIRVIGLNSTRGRRAAVVGVNGNEQVGLRLVGEISALIEREVGVAAPREHYFRPQSRLQQPAQTLGHVEHQILFQQSLPSNRAYVPPAVPGVEHDAKFAGSSWYGSFGPIRR